MSKHVEVYLDMYKYNENHKKEMETLKINENKSKPLNINEKQ